MKDPERSKRRKVAPAARPAKPVVTVDTYREDPLYLRIRRIVAEILQDGRVVAPVDVLVRMDLLAPAHLDDWLNGRVPYLEKVIRSNLTKLSRLLRVLRFHVHDLNLVPSAFHYMRRGGGSNRRLRFTKTGDPKLEEAYSRHYLWPGKPPFHPSVTNGE